MPERNKVWGNPFAEFDSINIPLGARMFSISPSGYLNVEAHELKDTKKIMRRLGIRVNPCSTGFNKSECTGETFPTSIDQASNIGNKLEEKGYVNKTELRAI